MDTREIERQGYLERWLAGRLVPAEREAYESHWFQSDVAFTELETALAIRSALVLEFDPPPSRAA